MFIGVWICLNLFDWFPAHPFTIPSPIDPARSQALRLVLWDPSRTAQTQLHHLSGGCCDEMHGRPSQGLWPGPAASLL